MGDPALGLVPSLCASLPVGLLGAFLCDFMPRPWGGEGLRKGMEEKGALLYGNRFWGQEEG